MNPRLSHCCSAPLHVEGRTTQYYVCDECNQPCHVKMGEQ